jgi:hypothetical protein
MRGVVQLVLERLPVTQEAAGSSPVAPANYFKLVTSERKNRSVPAVLPVFRPPSLAKLPTDAHCPIL